MQGTSNRSAYFPRGLWFSPYDGAPAVDATEGGRYVSVSVRTRLLLLRDQLWQGRLVPTAKRCHHSHREGRYLRGVDFAQPLNRGIALQDPQLPFILWREREWEGRQLAKASRPLMLASLCARRAQVATRVRVQFPFQATDASTLVRQAGVTDDVPLHVLAGNVVPLAKGHHMTTVDVQNSSLVLVVAVPKDNVAAPAVRLCALRCALEQAAHGVHSYAIVGLT